jgi:AcrR family transcriptional regulator
MPRDTLTAEQIVRTAIELLDTEGLDGLNMRSLGKRLDSAATAVYWHVKSKDNLVRLAGDEVWKEIELPDIEALDWRTAATAMATGLHAMMSRHPWLVQALASHLLYGPGKARHDDHTLAVYEMAGFTGAEADQAAAAVFMFVLGNTVGASATVSLTRRLSRDGGNAEELLRDTIAQASDIAKQFPRLRARIETTASDYNAAPDSSFEFGLKAILDGFEDRLAGR